MNCAQPSVGHSSITGIDSHAHVFRRDLPYASGRRHSPDYDASLSEYLRLLDAHGVSHGVLVQPSFLGTDNRFLLDALATCPHRLRGVAVVDPSVADDELERMTTLGVCGIRLNLLGAEAPPLRRGDWAALLRRVHELDWHVEVHVELAALPHIGQAILDGGGRLVVDHFGRPGAEGSDGNGLPWLLSAASSRRVWVKLSAAYRNWTSTASDGAAAAARRLLDSFGPERLVWGSDWPHTQHRRVASFSQSLAMLGDWVPDDAARRRILVDTASKLFRFSPGDIND